MRIGRRLGVLSLAILVCALVVAATALKPSFDVSSQDATATATDETLTNLVCPDPGKGNEVSVQVYDQTSAAELAEPESDVGPVELPVGFSSTAVTADGEAEAVRAGIELLASRMTWDAKAESRGLTHAPCLAPKSSAWLLGAGTRAGQRDRVQLINPTGSDSVVDLTVFTEEGELTGSGTTDLVVKAGTTREVKLDAVAPGEESLGVRVQARSGVVSSYLVDDSMSDLVPRGVSVSAPLPNPAKNVTIAGVPHVAGEQSLVLLAPRESAAVQITVTTAAGEQVVDQQISKGQITNVDIRPQLAGEAGTVRVTASHPVVAAVEVRTQQTSSTTKAKKAAVKDAEERLAKTKQPAERRAAERAVAAARAAAIDDGGDVAWLGSSPRISPDNQAAVLLGNAPSVTTLWTATGGDMQIDLTRVSTAGEKDLKPIAVSDGQTVVFDVPKVKDPGYALIATVTGPGTVFGRAVVTGEKNSLTAATVRPIPVAGELPPTDQTYGLS